MNTNLWKSKKFRAAVLNAVMVTLTFFVGKFQLDLAVDEIMTLITALSVPFLFYIGAEGYSERDAKAIREGTE